MWSGLCARQQPVLLGFKVMTKRLVFGFTFITCGLTVLGACSSGGSGGGSGGAANSGWGTGGATVTPGAGGGAAMPGTGGATVTPGTGGGGAVPATGGTAGGLATGGTSAVGTGATGTGATGTGATGSVTGGFVIGPGGYITSGEWHGYAWTSTGDDDTILSTIDPPNFETYTGAETCLHVTGTVGMDDDYEGIALLGININQADGTDMPTDVWTATGTGIAYNVTNTGGSQLRIQIQGAAGYPNEVWCYDISKTDSGVAMWADFNKTCWDNKGDYYDGSVPLNAVMLLVPGKNTTDVAYDVCLNSIAPG